MKKIKQNGGLVLRSKDLRRIIDEDNTEGIAFGVEKPGECADVNLLIYKVFKKAGNLVGKVRDISFKKGASKFDAPEKRADQFQFEYLAEMEKCKFGFCIHGER